MLFFRDTRLLGVDGVIKDRRGVAIEGYLPVLVTRKHGKRVEDFVKRAGSRGSFVKDVTGDVGPMAK